ncbi:MAG: efflux RND transporter periplasmic adaptor subunit [Elusimicrobium sp.]|uniref:Efflux RND transporter periplasmic adaptor subunit n=1 Tax=Candidatus Avelusimicrobium gallicola TaxID=2562704 RepID=A0A928HDN6_9BACT|nr:efflux RND transporter periplasmic adaptor subunit [Elusimicrobium sp.]
MKKRTAIRLTKYALVLLVGGLLGFVIKGKLSGGAQMNYGAAGQTSVLTEKVYKRPVALGKTFIAKVEAINASDVTPQVSGYIDKVLFKDGSFVKEGDVLFVIDQARYKAAVSAAEASLEKAKATLKQIESDYNRELSLYKEKMLSKADLEVSESNLANAKANVKAAQASFDLAKLDLAYTEVRSPISGYVGKALMTKGNYTNAASSKLARVIQMDPIRVVFSVTDKERLAGMDQLLTSNPDIQVSLPNGETIEIAGASLFTDNEINADTATMAVYAQSTNADRKLIPGNYVNVTVSASKFMPSILIAQTAVAQDASGQYVMTVNAENVVVQKYITVGDAVENQYVVISGLEEGDRVVPVGHQKLQNGQKVNVSESHTAAQLSARETAKAEALATSVNAETQSAKATGTEA